MAARATVCVILRHFSFRLATVREIEVLKWSAAGKTKDEIGDIINVTCDTIKFHLKNCNSVAESGSAPRPKLRRPEVPVPSSTDCAQPCRNP